MNGHITSATYKNYSNDNIGRFYGMLKVRIDDVWPVDHRENNSVSLYGTPSVQYYCRIIGSQYDGSYISNVMDACAWGGQYNYSEVVRMGVEEQGQMSTTGDKAPSLTNGDFALVMFVNGDMNQGVIVHGFPHPQNKRIGAKIADGRRVRFEYNGIEFHIDKMSNLRIRHLGRKSPKGTVENTKGVGSEWILYENGDAEFNANGGSGDDIAVESSGTSKDLRIKFSKETKKLEIYANTNEVVLDSNGTKITDKNSNIIELNSSGAKITDKNSNTVEMKSGEVSVKESGGGTLKLAGNKVGLGGSSAELLQQISDQLDKLSTLFNAVATHSHLGNLGFPSGPPTTQAQWTTAASDMTTIKGKIDGIKGGI